MSSTRNYINCMYTPLHKHPKLYIQAKSNTPHPFPPLLYNPIKSIASKLTAGLKYPAAVLPEITVILRI